LNVPPSFLVKKVILLANFIRKPLWNYFRSKILHYVQNDVNGRIIRSLAAVTSSVTALAVVTPSTENGEGHIAVVCLAAVFCLTH
jgi:hypothetical protein